MDFRFPAEVEELRTQVQEFIAENWPQPYRRYAMNDFAARDAAALTRGAYALNDALTDKLAHQEQVSSPFDPEVIKAFNAALGESGLLGYGIPVECGGRGGGALERYVVESELVYAGCAYPVGAVGQVAPTLIAVGDEELQRRYIPDIVNRGVEFAVGYSEPEAGTDLASLRTRAVRDGDHYVITGQKLYSTALQYADYYWVAARTDPSLPKHKGISLFILPAECPGLTVDPLITMSGVRTNIAFLDEVVVPASDRVGPENGGWSLVVHALSHERYTAIMAAPVVRAYEEAVKALGSRNGDARYVEALSRLEADVRAARLLGQYVAWCASEGIPITAQASAAKVYITELRHKLARTVLDLLGAEAVLGEGNEGAPAQGQFERMYRHSVTQLFTGGANAVQRDLISEASLGLPRRR